MVAVLSLEHADPWASDFIDVGSINAHASDAVAARIAEKGLQARQGPDRLHSSSLLILGPAGAGKTHLFARLRKRFGASASFVLVRPELGICMTPRHMLAAIIDSLHRRCHGLEIRQIDAVVGALLAAAHQADHRYPLLRIEDLRRDEDRQARLEAVIETLESRYDELHTPYLERLLAFPFASSPDRRALLAWLSGRELDDTQLKRLGLASALAEQDIIPALRTLAIAAAFGAPVVVVFDQLENLVEEDGKDRIHAHARLVSELFDSVRGLVIVQMALDAEWQQRISPVLSQSERDRLEARTHTLTLPAAGERETLLSAWLEAIPSSERKGYFPWPFDEQGWLDWRAAPGVTPRMLMVACREALEGRAEAPPTSPPCAPSQDSLETRMESQWSAHVDRARSELREATSQKRGIDRERLVSALLGAARLADIQAAPQTGRKPGDLRLEHQGREVLVFVVQQPSANSVASSLRRAAAAASSQDVVVLRERRIPFPSTWKSVTEPLLALRDQPRASWIDLDDDHVAHLLAMHDFLSSGRSRDITDARGSPLEESVVREWAARRASGARWMLAPALLAASDRQPEHPRAEAPSTPAPQPPAAPAAPAAPAPNGLAWRVLRELRVASVERVVAEVRASHPEVSRASVVAELRGAGAAIGWAGSAVVFVSEEAP